MMERRQIRGDICLGRFLASASWLMVAMGVAACSSGGGDASLGPSPTTPTADMTLLPFITAAGELKLLDPAAPSSPAMTVETGLNAPAVPAPFSSIGPYFRVRSGTYDGSTNRLSDGHSRTLFYIKQGQVFRVSLLKGTSTAPVRISSVSNACGFRSLSTDYAVHLNSGLAFETAGADNDCLTTADNDGRYFRMNAPVNTGGTVVSSTLLGRGTLLGADGSLVGILVQEGVSSARIFRRYDANFANPVDIAALASNTGVSSGSFISRTVRYYRLRLAGDTNHRLYRFDASTNALQSVHTYATAPTGSLFATSAADSSHLYFVDANTVHRVTNAGAASELLHTASSNTGFSGLTLSTNRVILHTTDSNTGQESLASLPKSGAVNLTSLEPDTAGLILHTTAGTRVYYSIGDASLGTLEAVTVVETNTGETRYPDADWGGLSFSESIDLGHIPEADVHSLLLGQADAAGVVSVSSVDALSGSVRFNLGAVASALQGFGTGVGRYLLANVEIDRTTDPMSPAADYDVYFADVQLAGSLRAVAATVGSDDAVAQ